MLCNNVFTLQTFAKFRCGVAPLRLETGRYERLSPEQRTCFFCTDYIESEEHVLLSCPVYDDLRLTVESVIKSGYAEYDSLTNCDKRNLLCECDKMFCQNLLRYFTQASVFDLQITNFNMLIF